MRRNILQWFFMVIFMLYGGMMKAQPDYPAPSGVWCSCPPSTGVGNGSVVPAVASKEYVKGILVRVVWKDIEPTDNTYNWALIDNQITAAQSYGKKISLAVGGGLNSPNWLYSLGVQSLSFSTPFSGTIPVPWDTIFLNKWTEFILELGNRYANDITIQLVYITNSSTNGFEMQLPFNPTPSYSTIGYTDQLVVDSWEQVMDAFDVAFPNHYLTNDFHPVNSSNAVADVLYSYATQNLGERYGANSWWWTQHNTTVYPNQYSILQNSATTRQFTGVQMAASGIDNPSTFGIGGMPEALNLAISNQVCYWEIWNNDIVDGSFDAILSSAVCTPLNTDGYVKNESSLSVFPNPSNELVTITILKGNIRSVEVMNELGQKVWNENAINESKYQLDISKHSVGIYFVKVTNENNVVYYKKIIKVN